MKPDVIEVWEDAETWRRIASMWSVCVSRAERRCFTDRTWEVMPKIAAFVGGRSERESGSVGIPGSRDGWGILTGWLANVGWRQVVNQHGGQVFGDKERQFANEVGLRLVRGTSICEAFRETGDGQP